MLKELVEMKFGENRLETILSVTDSSQYSNYDLDEKFDNLHIKINKSRHKRRRGSSISAGSASPLKQDDSSPTDFSGAAKSRKEKREKRGLRT